MNGCPAQGFLTTHFLYRAVSEPQSFQGAIREVSTIGYARSTDGVHFRDRRQFIVPTHDWDKFGCEDPRVTKLDGKYYIFYTALSTYPFGPEGIRTGLALTTDFHHVRKHPVTTFNSKAMALFPGRVKGKMAAVLTVHTDRPPAYIALALFDREDDMWSPDYWNRWHATLEDHIIPIQRSPNDHFEVGAPPLKTEKGWLFFYSYIRNYFAGSPTFGIEAVLLDRDDPQRVIASTREALLTPEEEYERNGKVPNIVFPSGAFIKKGTIHLYYGVADTRCALATAKLDALLKYMQTPRSRAVPIERFSRNPIIEPDASRPWEAKATFNPTAIHEGGKTHLLYRAMSLENTSVFGYAATIDGFRIEERLPRPAYFPRETFEMKKVPGANSGCEDPRITKIGSTLYMCYTAFDGKDYPRVALTTIPVADFLAKRWNWTTPLLISPPGTPDKDAAFFPKLFNGTYAILHRLGESIWIDFRDSLEFGEGKWLDGEILMKPRDGDRDSRKIGITGPPIETEKGWLLLYHGISKSGDRHYDVRAALLDLHDPRKVIARTTDTIFEPDAPYEREGIVPNVVFPCGLVTRGDQLFIYYGAADRVVGVATMSMKALLEKLLAER